ncbi:MAG: TIGR04282 family arsenosugar biosynthesis glycosyltransferase [Betaproteobacteria bacterium]
MNTTPITFQLFAKAPVAGTVKTRLHPVLSAADAATLHTRLIDRTAAALAGVRAELPQAALQLWGAPDCEHPALRAVAAQQGLSMHRQSGNDLGARMRDALSTAMPGYAVLVGSDCPLVDTPLLLRAAAALRDADAVFVPADDGGYALVGCRGAAPDCFEQIPWSTGGVMSETRAQLSARGTTWLELPVVWDVDTPADLARLATDVRFSHLLSGLTDRSRSSAGKEIEQPSII